MKCGNCGNEVKDDAQFCSNCGHSIEEPSEESVKSHKTARGAYALSVLALIIVLALVAYGGFVIIYRDLHPQKTVSASDEKNAAFNYDSQLNDSALIGKWVCNDRAAADYGENNFGVEVKIILTLTDDGKFTHPESIRLRTARLPSFPRTTPEWRNISSVTVSVHPSSILPTPTMKTVLHSNTKTALKSCSNASASELYVI